MKKLLFLGFAIASLSANAQTYLSQNFEDPTGWTVSDLDGDGKTWGLYTFDTDENGFSAGNVAYSASWDGETLDPLTPDNLLISPAVTLPAGSTYTLSYKIGPADPEFPAEHYAVYVLPSTTAFSETATPIKEETLGDTDTEAKTKTVNISSFAGQTVKIYFRHFKVSDQYLLMLDDVLVEGILGTVDTDTKQSLSIYPNPTTDYLNINSSSKLSHVYIYDAAGKLIQHAGYSKQIDVRSLQKGLYILQLEDESGKKSTHKFIKK